MLDDARNLNACTKHAWVADASFYLPAGVAPKSKSAIAVRPLTKNVGGRITKPGIPKGIFTNANIAMQSFLVNAVAKSFVPRNARLWQAAHELFAFASIVAAADSLRQRLAGWPRGIVSVAESVRTTNH